MVTMDMAAMIIEQTKKWITSTVVGCNFCPFAAREVKRNSIHYEVEFASDLHHCLTAFLQECTRLDKNATIETTLLIFPNAFQTFKAYLDLLFRAEKAIKKNRYEGVYQVASFHPLYRFSNTPDDDPANYTNRSVYPMLHLLREEKIEQALQHYPNPDQIPLRNIQFAREKGLDYMRNLRDSCLSDGQIS